MQSNQVDFMTLAVELASKGRLTVSPNPMVGCVIVKNDKIVGQGYHICAGQDHAEIIALKEAGQLARGAEVFLNLEPCCHYGKTPPCTDALIKAGVKKVYVSCLDPNPLVAGQGVEVLRECGIEVDVGLLQDVAIQLNEVFFHYITYSRPLVIAKWAMSLNGKTAINSAKYEYISGQEAQFHTHKIRQFVDAILIGSNTAIIDNPQLTVRLENTLVLKQPIRIILTGTQLLPLHLKVLSGDLPGKTIIVTTRDHDAAYYRPVLMDLRVELMVVPELVNRVSGLHALLHKLAKLEITSVLVEGGMQVIDNFFQAKLVDKISIYLAPCIIFGQEKYTLPKCELNYLGSDIYLHNSCRRYADV